MSIPIRLSLQSRWVHWKARWELGKRAPLGTCETCSFGGLSECILLGLLLARFTEPHTFGRFWLTGDRDASMHYKYIVDKVCCLDVEYRDGFNSHCLHLSWTMLENARSQLCRKF